ncbi:DUF3531 family protein [Synechococcus sp. PCC 7336]|uniref:DUF3531 family protein n=1 Tax=Synechococcus sp. PCC 7336 TaxID=195250 RepID=UPI00034A5A4E|nr:DUF3531 family protein [Synechococcus sp. PCC 7336]
MQVEFRECNWSDLWIWFEFPQAPLEMDKQYLEQVLESWYTVGMLGGYNASTLQVQEAGLEISHMEYDTEGDRLPSLMHNMGSMEYEGNWGRCWFDLGTADALALDVLLNAVQRLSLEYVDIERVIVGGQSETWPIAASDRSSTAHLN